MALDPATPEYLNFNSLQTKSMAVVIEIEGLDFFLSSAPLFSIHRYGDVGLDYGDAGVFYGGQVRRTDVKDILQVDKSGLIITQKIEPEQGKGSISTMQLSFVDKDEFMTQVISPGILLDDILGKEVKVHLGYQQLSFPEQYFVVYRGRVSQAHSIAGRVVLQVSDPNLKRNGQVFFTAKTTLSASISDSDTTIPVVSNGDFFEQISNPLGAFDPAVKTYLIIEDEIIEYPSGGFGVNEFTSVTRAARSTTAAAHASGVEVAAAIQIEDHIIDMSLKLMLSGFAGDWKTDEPITALVVTGDPSLGNISNAIILPPETDAQRDFGLVAGDFVTTSGATSGANDKTAAILAFESLQGTNNRILLMDDTYTVECPSPAVLAFRSQFDVYPVLAGGKLNPPEVDIDQHTFLKNTFLGLDEFSLQFFITEQEDSLKTFMEKDVYLPFALYSLTRQGKLSLNITKPPIADQRLQTLDNTNILNAPKINVKREINNRRFFNEIDWTWDLDDSGVFRSRLKQLDTTSLTVIGVSKVLPIESRGGKTSLGYELTIARRTRFLLLRYRQGAVMINVVVNWEVGSLIEVGDVILLNDPGNLKITNIDTGIRQFNSQLLEVIDRKYDIKTGKVNLSLLTGIGADVNDRFATISPSSLVGAGSTTTRIIIKESFGAIFPGRERDKWIDYEGLPIRIHNEDYSFDETTTLVDLPASNLLALDVSPALSAPPPEDHIVDIVDYSTSTDALVNALYKLIHAHWTPSVDVVSGADDKTFDVSVGDIGKFKPGQLILIHNGDFSIESPEVEVDTVGATTVTVKTSLGFTPSASQTVDLMGFADFVDGKSGGPYRWI